MAVGNLWIIIPTYNERENMGALIAGIFSLGLGLSLLVVDDASPDGTAAAVRQLQSQYPRLHLLERPAKQGLGSAYRAGFAYALAQGAEVVGEMDADLSHAPEDLPRLCAALAGRVGVVIGSRRVPGGQVVGWSAWRRLMSWGATTVSRIVLGLKTRDVTAGFRLYTKAALAAIPWQRVASDGYAWQEELLFLLERAKVPVVEVPVTFTDRIRGRSKLGWQQVVEFFSVLLRLSVQRWRG